MREHRTDKEYLKLIRDHVTQLIKGAAVEYDKPGIKVLEIGPAEYNEGRKHFKRSIFRTLDKEASYQPDYVVDISQRGWAHKVGEDFNLVICTEVLEHVENPFCAIEGICQLFEWTKNSILILSVPLNFRIHGCGGYSEGPAPDFWRFTESGIRVLLKDFHIERIDTLESDRGLFPIHYNVIARKK